MPTPRPAPSSGAGGLPWRRWPRVCRFALPVLAFAVVSVNSAEGLLPRVTTGVWYVLVFVWVGMWGAPRAVIALGPVAVASYLVPFALGAPHTGGDVSAVALVVPVAMVLGVLVSRDKAAEAGRRLAEGRSRRSWSTPPSHCSPATARAQSPSTRRARPGPGRRPTTGSCRPTSTPSAVPTSAARSSMCSGTNPRDWNGCCGL